MKKIILLFAFTCFILNGYGQYTTIGGLPENIFKEEPTPPTPTPTPPKSELLNCQKTYQEGHTNGKAEAYKLKDQFKKENPRAGLMETMKKDSKGNKYITYVFNPSVFARDFQLRYRFYFDALKNQASECDYHQGFYDAFIFFAFADDRQVKTDDLLKLTDPYGSLVERGLIIKL